MKVLCRYILAITGFFGIVCEYLCRINLSMALVPMLGENTKNTTFETVDGVVIRCNDTDEIPISHEETFDWTPEQKGLMLGSYYYGYTICTIPVAWVAGRYGFKRTYGYSMLIASVLCCVFPFIVKLDFYLGVVSRILLGVFHCGGFPCFAQAWGIWAPPGERTRLNGIVISGLSFGTALIFFIAGGIIETFGWESIFYVTGVISLLWCLVWFYLVYESPETHPRIDPKERDYILKSLGSNGHRKRLITPWKSIMTSVPVWSIIIAHFAFNWCNYTLNQQLPTYLTSILRLDLQLTGLLSSLGFLLQGLMCLLLSWITDWIICRKFMSTICIRRINTMIALWFTGVLFVSVGYAGCNVNLAIFLLVLTTGFNILVTPGCKSNMLDIAPAFSGIIFAISNTIANIPGFIAPQVAGSILQENTLSEWQSVFWLSAVIQVLCSFLFLFKGTDKVQEWAKVEQNKKIENDINGSQDTLDTVTHDQDTVNNKRDIEAELEDHVINHQDLFQTILSEKEITRLFEQVDSQNPNTESLNNIIDSKSKIKMAAEEKNKMAPEIKNEMAAVENEMGTAENEIETAENEMGTAENKMGTAENKMGTAENEIGTAENEMAAFENQIDTVVNEIEAVENEMAAFENEIVAVENSEDKKKIAVVGNIIAAEIENKIIAIEKGMTAENENNGSIDKDQNEIAIENGMASEVENRMSSIEIKMAANDDEGFNSAAEASPEREINKDDLKNATDEAFILNHKNEDVKEDPINMIIVDNIVIV